MRVFRRMAAKHFTVPSVYERMPPQLLGIGFPDTSGERDSNLISSLIYEYYQDRKIGSFTDLA